MFVHVYYVCIHVHLRRCILYTYIYREREVLAQVVALGGAGGVLAGSTAGLLMVSESGTTPTLL